jgi:hypothetical protein
MRTNASSIDDSRRRIDTMSIQQRASLSGIEMCLSGSEARLRWSEKSLSQRARHRSLVEGASFARDVAHRVQPVLSTGCRPPAFAAASGAAPDARSAPRS